MNISNKSLSDDEINRRVEKYVLSTYFPVLVKNYISIYKKMKQEKANFSQCKKASYFEFSKNIQATLCVEKKTAQNIEISYKTLLQNNSPKTNASFIFDTNNLIGINLHTKEEVAFSIKDL